MASPSLPPIASLSSLDTQSRAGVLDVLFEPSTQLHTLSISSLKETQFTSYAELVAHVQQQLTDLFNSSLESDQKWLDAILVAHPRLGEKKVDSALSRKEQEAMRSAEGRGQAQQAADVAEKLADLNRKYEDVFQGLRYVTFVHGRPRPVLMQDMETRITRNDIRQERADAIQAMCDIANDRAGKLGAA